MAVKPDTDFYVHIAPSCAHAYTLARILLLDGWCVTWQFRNPRVVIVERVGAHLGQLKKEIRASKEMLRNCFDYEIILGRRLGTRPNSGFTGQIFRAYHYSGASDAHGSPQREIRGRRDQRIFDAGTYEHEARTFGKRLQEGFRAMQGKDFSGYR